MFERQTKNIPLDVSERVTQFLALLFLVLGQIIFMISEEEVHDYAYIKLVQLSRFKLSSEAFRPNIVQYVNKQKLKSKCIDFTYELYNFLKELLD